MSCIILLVFCFEITKCRNLVRAVKNLIRKTRHHILVVLLIGIFVTIVVGVGSDLSCSEILKEPFFSSKLLKLIGILASFRFG